MAAAIGIVGRAVVEAVAEDVAGAEVAAGADPAAAADRAAGMVGPGGRPPIQDWPQIAQINAD